MQPEMTVVLVALGISMTVNVILAVNWVMSGRRIRWLEEKVLGAEPDHHADRLEQAVDMLQSQVEQLSSGQEFLNRIISQRAGERERVEPPHAVTPH